MPWNTLLSTAIRKTAHFLKSIIIKNATAARSTRAKSFAAASLTEAFTMP